MATTTTTIYQFGFTRRPAPVGMPVIDCRIIDNTFSLERIRAHRNFRPLVDRGIAMLQSGTCTCIAVGCAFGKHRSGEVARAIQRAVGGCQIVRL